MATVKVSRKHQIAVPSEVRRKLGIKPGDRLEVTVEKDRVVLTPELGGWGERWASIAPDIWQGVDVESYLGDLRDEWSSREH